MFKIPKLLAPVHPNAGLELTYQRKLESLVEQMHRSLKYWILAAYRAKLGDMVFDAEIVKHEAFAFDMSPAMYLRWVMHRLGKYWTTKFDLMALEMAKYFATNAKDRVDGKMNEIQKAAGFAIPFTYTAAMNNAMQATIGEQVGLIRSIAAQHLSTVETLVMQSVQTGRDLKTLSEELESRYHVTKRRAALIARDQNNKATAMMTRVRQHEMGAVEAVWQHSHAGKEPRPEHVKWDGKRYKIAEGMWSDVDQCYVWPGTQINCRCISKTVNPILDN